MALNIPLLQALDASSGRIPSPFTGEVYILSRTAMELAYTDATRPRASPAKGVLFMTTQRLVFPPEDRAKAGYASIELPFRGMTGGHLRQPIFSCNNSTASCTYYDGMPFTGELGYKIVIKNGGIGVSLPPSTAASVRRGRRQPLPGGEGGRGGGGGGGVAPENPAPDAWANEWGAGNLQGAVAAVDPSDPSRQYLTQPVVEGAGAEGRGTMPPLTERHASAGGLRHRG
ncbi:hypothetical protein BU14_0731s0002 [Porphyra umbilicalis]|uniref:GRAM domain-containing protein n=1 Tax=Porphyra umbilicalis TaxID=2786 RepID=A0A1X6NPK6_PORUM|nr:hypothetical protein BU14_0731s0002 [Porphyra umbilicalis]|eukprot:OSX70527.1 hypothetical protein BU14_0731s0002 [Porphyra umbilicalis]